MMMMMMMMMVLVMMKFAVAFEHCRHWYNIASQ